MYFCSSSVKAGLFGIFLALVSCRAPKSKVPEKPPTPAPVAAQKPEPTPPPPAPESLPDDGIRMGNMLDLPTDSEFRSTNPNLAKPPGAQGPVIARPPTDPPSRVAPSHPDNPE
jgi:hypothetical protein